jgi:signal transduction histidine kinase
VNRLWPPGGWTLARRVSVLVGLGWAGVVLALGVLFAVTGRNAAAVDELVNKVGPVRRGASDVITTMVEAQNALRGYALTANPAMRTGYSRAAGRVDAQLAQLHATVPSVDPAAARDLDTLIGTTATWRAQGATPLLDEVAAGGVRTTADRAYLDEELGFGRVLDSARNLVSTLEARRDAAAQRLAGTRVAQLGTLVGAGVLAAVAGLLTILLVRRWVTAPIERLAADARRVADGDHEHRVRSTSGPPELAGVAGDVERMRSRIVAELDELEASQERLRATQRELQEQAVDLMRSNRDLEQFAYVASHDLQEPLRKVAGFCQLLQRRYAGQLDDRAGQYIDFAVDGARRMQELISELLRFSRVGRVRAELKDVPLAEVAAEAVGELGDAVRGADGEVEVGELPSVRGDPVLLRQLLTNLVGNGLKFHRDGVPARVRIRAVPDPAGWRISVSDNGIGIDPTFAEKIFVLFGRLHSRESYEGTGIGLALAKRIVEYHGGQIWLDTEDRDGTTILFTLRAAGDGGPVGSGEEAR